MASLSMSEIARVAATAGFTGNDVAIATAVTQPESGGKPEERAVSSREDSRGLWQINILAHPEFANTNLYDPTANAQAAYAVWKEQGWRAWTGYTSGAYLLYLPAAKLAASGISTTPATATPTTEIVFDDIRNVGSIPGDIAGSLKSMAALAMKTGAWISDPGNWLRVGQVIIGGAMIAIGLGIIARPVIKPVVDTVQKAQKKVGDIATTVAVPEAKAAKTAATAATAKKAAPKKAAPKKAAPKKAAPNGKQDK